MTESPETTYLLTPGPLTTAPETRQAMLRDWGSRDPAFIELTRRVRARLLDLAAAADSHVCVPVQGSGTFAVEATLGTLIPRGGRAAVLVNGAYGERMARILEVAGREAVRIADPEDRPSDVAALDAALAADPAIGHVCAVHCETSSGILNPIEAIAAVVERRGRSLIIDAMSAFGALPLDARRLPFDAVVASANKCLEGVPGVGFALIRRAALEACAGRAHSLSLDLYDQWRALEGNGQWRFTPPTHVLAAFDRALEAHAAEDGVAGRRRRYAENCRILVEGMRRLGFRTLLPGALQAPIIVTFRMPADSGFAFERFYALMAERGFIIYPGKLTVAESFRIGCIGHVGAPEMRAAVAAVEAALAVMGVDDGTPAAA